MAASSTPHRWSYDVFVSFRGDDVRKGFMDHLFENFKQKGIRAFRDANDLPRGENISSQLDKAIKESRFLLVIFSKHYASSSWCMRELVKILEHKKTANSKQEVQIIFYDANPDVVRKQTGSYAEAFAKHEVSNRREVDIWRKALSMASDLSGWDLRDMTNGYESKFIDAISNDIFKKLCIGTLDVGENLVGVDARVDKLDLGRFIGSDNVHMIGICGISGMGKTTLAKSIYNIIYTSFEGSCFCEDVQGVTKRQGLTQVQMQLIEKIMNTSDVKIASVSEGIMIIRKGMASKPILLVLDDVDHREQLEALAGSRDWFFPGSCIIFTSKDQQLLRSHQVDGIYEMGFLDDYESLELFCLYAFRRQYPTEVFRELALQFVEYLHGHPLALKVFGCFLYKKCVRVWRSELDRLHTYPNSEIQKKLRPAFDGLDFDQKRIFLDIAFSLIGENKDFAASVLEHSDCFPDSNMEVLADRSLITVSSNLLHMHELIQSMAREIVREESNIPGNRSRLSVPSEVYDVLHGNKATETVEVLHLLEDKCSEKVHMDSRCFANMKNLRILKIPKDSKLKFSGILEYLPNNLRYLCWHGYPFKLLPSNFYPQSIVAIDLSYSRIKHLWSTSKCFKSLKVMKLRYCCDLKSTPNFSETTNLEELILEGCVSLVELHPSIGMLKRLVVLDMRDCTRLRSFPSKVEMDSLRVLSFSGCLKVDKLPEALGRIKSLVELHLDRTAIKELPCFVLSLENLQSLSFGGHQEIPSRWWPSIFSPFSFLSKSLHPKSLESCTSGGLPMFRFVNLSYCNIFQVPDSIGGLSCLKSLNLGGNNFTSLPRSLSQLSQLGSLTLDGCNKLEVLPVLPHNLSFLSTYHCTSLRKRAREFNHRLLSCNITGRPNKFRKLTVDSQVSVSQTQLLDSSITSHGATNQLSSFLQRMSNQINKYGIFEVQGHTFCRSDKWDILFYADSIPHWFRNHNIGNHVMVRLPSDGCHNKFRGYGTCIVYKRKKPYGIPGYIVRNFDGTILGNASPFHCFPLNDNSIGIHESHVIWLHYNTSIWEWKEAKSFASFTFKDNEDVEVKECAVTLFCEEDIQQETDSMIQDLPNPTRKGGIFTLHGNSSISSLFW